MTIGQKIKQIRKEKSLSQENVYPSNQSLVSLIEKGVIKNPSEQTLRIMADNMDMAFDELIEGTEWEIPRNVTKKSEYSFSQTECVVHIDDSGEIKTRMKSYPLIESSGEENKFDPDTGYILLTECKSCKRGIQQPNQKYCFGCGEKLFNNYTWYERMYNYDHVVDDSTGDEAELWGDEYNEAMKGHIGGFTPYIGYNTFFTLDIKSNQRAANNLSSLLMELNEIDKVINPAVPYIASHKMLQGTNSILMKMVGVQYYPYFKSYYFSVTKDQMNLSTTMGGATEDINHFHPGPMPVPIGVAEWPDGKPDTTDIYDDGYMLYDLVDINPNKCKSDIIVNWWVLFKRDLSMTKGLLNEVLRHQKRLVTQAEEEGDETIAKPNETEPNEEG